MMSWVLLTRSSAWTCPEVASPRSMIVRPAQAMQRIDSRSSATRCSTDRCSIVSGSALQLPKKKTQKSGLRAHAARGLPRAEVLRDSKSKGLGALSQLTQGQTCVAGADETVNNSSLMDIASALLHAQQQMKRCEHCISPQR